MNDLANRNELSLWAEQVEDFSSNLPALRTEDLVDAFAQIDRLKKAANTADKQVKDELKSRASEGGSDAKGHVFLAGQDARVKLEKRVTITVKDDAVLLLGTLGLLAFFPRRPDPEKMLAKLNELGVDPLEYSDPVVDKATLEDLVARGIVPEDVAVSVLEASESFAVKVLSR